jgi:hypothetical protein
MSKSIDLGRNLMDSITVQALGPDDKHYPDLYISDVDDPAIADMPDKGECTIKYRILSRTHREEKDGNGKKHSCSIRLEVVSIIPPEKKKKNGNGYGDDVRRSFSDYWKDK